MGLDSGVFTMNKALITDIELFAAALSQTHVVVSKDGEHDNAGIIREYCDKYVRIGDSWFARSHYGFHVMDR